MIEAAGDPLTSGEYPDFMTVDRLAEILSVSNMTAYRLVHSGEIRSKRVGRQFRVYKSSVREYLGLPENGSLDDIS